MDNLLQELGGQRPKTPIEEAWHKEQERKKYDIIRVAHPLIVKVKNKEYAFAPEDFYQTYDINQYQKIPAGSIMDIPRYIAIRYVQDKMVDIINKVAKKLHDDYLIDRDKKGLPRYKDKSVENDDTYLTQEYPKSDDPVLVTEIYDQLWVGVVHEFGRDLPPAAINPRSGEVDLTPIGQKVIDSFNNRRVSPEDNPVTQFVARPVPMPQTAVETIPQQPSGFAAMNERLDASEVTSE